MKTVVDHQSHLLSRRMILFALAGWVVSSLILIGMDQTQRIIVYERAVHYQEGDVSKESFVINHDFTFIDKEATAKLKALNRSMTHPVYIVRNRISQSVLREFDHFATVYTNIMNGSSSPEEQERFRKNFHGAANIVDMPTPQTPEQMEQILMVARQNLQDIQSNGIFKPDSADTGDASGIVEVVYSEMNMGQRVARVRTSLFWHGDFTEKLETSESLKHLPVEYHGFIIALVVYFSEANAFYSRVLTEENMDSAEAKTEAVRVSIASGTPLLHPDDIITSRQAQIFKELIKKRRLGFSDSVNSFLIMAIIIALGLFIVRAFDIPPLKSKSFWLYSGLLFVYLLITSFLNTFIHFTDSFSMSLILPTALFILFLSQFHHDKYLIVLTAILMALLSFFLTSGNPHDFLITLGAGAAGAATVTRRDSILNLTRIGPRLAIIMASATFITGILFEVPIENASIMAAIAAANGLVTGVISLVLFPFLGSLLNVTTAFRLIELSDQNNPALRKLRLQAPGTYAHSQSVAQLAEAACDEINADALLARVGAYYHDIGKTDQAHFFVENQSDENKHDTMKASLSVAVIRSHVKFGIEKGRELRLPDEILAIIEQHHGTSLIRCFYDRAVRENGGSTLPDDYSYGGPTPRSKEAAVVMLADSAEAAVRSMKNPSKAKTEKCILDIIMDRFKTQELSESGLTLKDLDEIRQSFIRVFVGQFHARIEYPENKSKK